MLQAKQMVGDVMAASSSVQGPYTHQLRNRWSKGYRKYAAPVRADFVITASATSSAVSHKIWKIGVMADQDAVVWQDKIQSCKF
jgi:hypothetical protein